MKRIIPTLSRLLTAVLAISVFHVTSRSVAGGVDDLEQQFPHVIQYELGAWGFSAGDQITITSVRGDRSDIEPGGGYLVEGTYTLASAESADLALYCTTRGPSGPTPVQSSEIITVTKGAGKFHLYEMNIADGWLHVSFYSGDSKMHGGVYVGEKGRENTIMRDQEWFREFDVKSPGTPANLDVEAAKANRALLNYLGNPVAPPAGMDSRYDRENLLKAFTSLCHDSGLIITKLAVDDSEFPFIVYGTLDGHHKLPDASAFELQKGYTYGGSVRGNFSAGSYFAVNMVPSSEYPADRAQACNRRLMLRLQMLADKAQQTQ